VGTRGHYLQDDLGQGTLYAGVCHRHHRKNTDFGLYFWSRVGLIFQIPKRPSRETIEGKVNQTDCGRGFEAPVVPTR
jgi:hypothetical protein